MKLLELTVKLCIRQRSRIIIQWPVHLVVAFPLFFFGLLLLLLPLLLLMHLQLLVLLMRLLLLLLLACRMPGTCP